MPIVKSSMAGKSPQFSAGGASGKSHEHFAGEFGSAGRHIGQKQDSHAVSAGKMLRAQQSLKKADAAHKKAAAAKTTTDQVAHAREAARHAENARQHLRAATAPEHAADSEKLRSRAERIHASALAAVSRSEKTPEKEKAKDKSKTMISTPTKSGGERTAVKGVVGAFAASVHADIARRPAQQSVNSLTSAQGHLTNAAKHLQNFNNAETTADKSRHAASAMDSSRAAINAVRDSARVTSMSSKHGAMISQAAAISQIARAHLEKSDSPEARVMAERAQRAHASMKSSQVSSEISTGASKSLHDLAAAKHRAEASKMARASIKHFEDTGEGHAHQAEMHELLASLKKPKRNKR